MEVSLQIDFRHRAFKTADLRTFADRARSAARLRGTVTILITSNEKMQALNRTFRGKDKPTDVLSFPTAITKISGHSGDIAISAEIAIENAQEYGHSAADEVKILILHGMLHLAGHDHETDQGQMARVESKLRDRLGLADSLISRTDTTSSGRMNQPQQRLSSQQAGKIVSAKNPAAPRRNTAKRRALLTR